MKHKFAALLCLLLASACWGQVAPSSPAITTRQVNMPIYEVNVSPATQASTSLSGNPGPQTIYYWMVTNFTLGASSPVGPFLVPNAPNTLSSGNYVIITPVYPAGIVSIDLLKTSTPTPPSGGCNCAVQTGVTSGSINDQSNSMGVYTVSPVDESLYQLHLQNEVQSAGVTHLILRQGPNYTFVADLSISGGFTVGGDLASNSSSSQEVIGILNHALPALSVGFLQWDGSAWVFSAGAGVTGSGTNCLLAEWTGTSTIGNGPLCDEGITGGYGIIDTTHAASPYQITTTMLQAGFPNGNTGNLGPFSGRAAVNSANRFTNSNCYTGSGATCDTLWVTGQAGGSTADTTNLIVGLASAALSANSASSGGNFQGAHFASNPVSGSGYSSVVSSYGLMSTYGCGSGSPAASSPIISTATCASTSSGASTTITNEWAGYFTGSPWTTVTTDGGLYSGLNVAVTGSPITITNHYGLFVDSPLISGANNVLTHNYGVYVADQTTAGTGTLSDPWGFYEAGTAKNQLGGPLTLLGNLTTNVTGSTQCLHVNSFGVVTGTGADCGSGGGTTFGGDLATITSSTQKVVGIETVPFCTGFTPTNGQAIEYTTASSPNPCWTAATVSNGITGIDYFPLTATSATAATSRMVYVDASAGYTSGDAGAAILASIAAIPSTQGILLDLAGFSQYGPAVPVTTNPFENQQFGGEINWGPVNFVTAVPWLTPGGNGKYRLFTHGTGTADPGTTISVVNSMLTACTSEAPGWNGTNCVINGTTVPAWGASGHSITFAYPHGAFGAATYYPLWWECGMGPSGVTLGGCFGHILQGVTLNSGGSGGADFGYYSLGIQEDSGIFMVSERASNRACGFVDGVGGTAGIGHYSLWGGECRDDASVTPAQGYPNEANQLGNGYGWWEEGNADVVYFTGANCSVYPQGYPTSFSGGAITAIKMTYAGTCSAAPTCHVGSNRGSGATCTASYSGGAVTGINVTAGGSGYALGDTGIGAPYEFGGMTPNGSSSNPMQEGVVFDGVYDLNVGPLHGEWFSTNGYTLHVGYGSGFVQYGTIHNVDLGNTGLGSVHLGVGIDGFQVLTSIGKGGSVGPIQDDAYNFTASAANPVPQYFPRGVPVLNSIVDLNGNPFLASTNTANAVDSVTIANAATANPATVAVEATGTDANININLVPKGTGVVECGGTPCGLISSVSNSDGTLTVTPTTGAVVASINLAHANSWSGQQTFLQGISVAPSSTSQVSGIFNNPISTTVDIVDFDVNSVKLASVTDLGGFIGTNVTDSALTQYGGVYPSSSGGLLATATPGVNQGTYLFGRANTTQGTATAPVDIQQGDCASGGSTINGASSTYTVLYSDVAGCYVTHDIAGSAAVIVTIPTPTTLNNPAPIFAYENDSAHIDVLTPTTYTISLGDNAATATLNVPAGVYCRVKLDPHNASTWKAICSPNTTASSSGTGTTNVLTKFTNTSGGIGNSTITDNGTLISTTEGISVAPTGSSQVAAIFNLPSGSSATYIAEFQLNGTNEAAINLSGEAFFGSGAPNPTTGTSGGLVCGEGTAPTLVSGQDGIYCNSSHYLDLVNGATDYGAVDAASNTNTLTNKSMSGANNTFVSIALLSLASEAANTLVGALTATTPSALAVPSCSGATNALTWTSGTGFGCNTINGGVTSVNTLTGAVVIEAATSGQMAVSGGASAALTGAADMTYATHTFSTTANGIFDWSAATGAGAVNLPAVVGGTQLTGTVTANLSAPMVIQNTNSSTNNDSITLGITAPGTSTGQTVLNVNGATTGGDLIDAGTGGTWASGVLSGQSIIFSITPTGEGKFGASAPSPTVGTSGGLVFANGTAYTGLSATSGLYGNSTNSCVDIINVTTDWSCALGITSVLGNLPVTMSFAQTTGSQAGFTVKETTAASGSSDVGLQTTTLTTSTAIPFQITQGAAGPAATNAPAVLNISAAATGGAATASIAGLTGAPISLITGAGSAGGATTGNGGAGGAFTVALGAGGAHGGNTANTGGVGGAFSLTPGAGTAGAATGAGGAAGTYTVAAATGGAGGSTSGTGGAGSDFLVTTGTGGAATAGSTTGRGGNATFTLGSAGGTGTAGAPGIFTIAAGTVGAANTSPAFTVTNTLNTTGVDGGVELFNTTCTAAAANSKQFDFQIGGVSQFNLSFLAANCSTPLITSLGRVKAAGFVDTSIGMTTSAMSPQTTATLTAITGMSWTLIANKNYRLGCDIPITFAATATVAFGLVGPGTPTSYNLDAYGLLGVSAVFADINVIGATTWVSTTTTTSGAVGAATEIAHVNAEIQNGSTAGTLTLDTAANGTNSITVGANAQCVLTGGD